MIVLRNPEAWRASRVDQLGRTGLADKLCGLPDVRQTGGDWYYDQTALLGFLNAVGDPRVIDYDAVTARDGSVLPAAFSALERPMPGNAKGEYWLNARVTTLETEEQA